MATCPHCKNTTWKLHVLEAEGAANSYHAVQCAECEAPIGFLDLKGLELALDAMDKKIDYISTNLTALSNVMNLMAGRMR